MNMQDATGCAVSGASGEAVLHHARALHSFQSWRGGALQACELALEAAPAFVMAHVLRAYILLCGRESRNLPAARQALASIAGASMNERERAHVRIVEALCQLRLEQGMALLDAWLVRQPTDILALQVAHAFDYLLGNRAGLRDRMANVLPRWSPETPGYSVLLVMHAFGLAENSEGGRAVDVGLQALALDPGSPRVHHALAHAFEGAGRPEQGLDWLNTHVDAWSRDAVVTTHLWWHQALQQLRAGCAQRALSILDAQLLPASGKAPPISDLVDASSLLWRLYLAGLAADDRARQLAGHWRSHLREGFCTFNDLHAAMALSLADDWRGMADLARVQRLRAMDTDSYAMTTREVGIPAVQGVAAFARGDYALAARRLGTLPMQAFVIGGSGAQRSVLALTFEAAHRRSRSAATTVLRQGAGAVAA